MDLQIHRSLCIPWVGFGCLSRAGAQSGSGVTSVALGDAGTSKVSIVLCPNALTYSVVMPLTLTLPGWMSNASCSSNCRYFVFFASLAFCVVSIICPVCSLFRALGWFSSLSEPHLEMPSVVFKWHLHTARFQVVGKYEAIKEI